MIRECVYLRRGTVLPVAAPLTGTHSIVETETQGTKKDKPKEKVVAKPKEDDDDGW